MPNNILPKMVSVSRDCGFTRELESILTKNLSDYELEVFGRWLNIVQEEKNNCKNITKKF